MSSIKLSPNASGTGIFTVAAPNSNTDRTLTLPDATGTVQVSGNPISGTTGSFSGDLSFNSGYGSAAVAYGCRAWVNFNGQGTVAIRASGNVSSLTDNGVGRYTVNFTTAMPDTNYSAVGGGGGEIRNNTLVDVAFPDNLRAAGSVGVDTQYQHVTAFDFPFVSVSIFR